MQAAAGGSMEGDENEIVLDFGDVGASAATGNTDINLLAHNHEGDLLQAVLPDAPPDEAIHVAPSCMQGTADVPQAAAISDNRPAFSAGEPDMGKGDAQVTHPVNIESIDFDTSSAAMGDVNLFARTEESKQDGAQHVSQAQLLSQTDDSNTNSTVQPTEQNDKTVQQDNEADFEEPDLPVTTITSTQAGNEDDDFDFDFEAEQKKSKPVIPVDQQNGNAPASHQQVQLAEKAVQEIISSALDEVKKENNLKRQEDKEDSAPVAKESPHQVTVQEQTSVDVATEAPKPDTIQKAEDEWGAVETVTPAAQQEASKLLSYFEAMEYSKTCDYSQYKSSIKTHIERSKFSAFKHALFGPPKMHRDLLNERETVFLLAATPLSKDDTTHTRFLQTIYRRLTGSKFDCSRFGSHWEQIGFQGDDPGTDLRSSGMLALYHLIYFLSDPNLLPLAREIYKLSTHTEQNFPFCVMSINMSRICIQALRQDCLNKECNKRKSVINVVNDFYTSCYFHLYTLWKKGHKTIKDSGFVIKDLETAAFKKSAMLLRNLEAHLDERRKGAGGGGSRDTGDGEGGPLVFSDLPDADD